MRPPVVYGPRDTDVFPVAEIHLERAGARDRGRRALVQRDLRRRTWWRASSRPRARRRRPDARYFLAHPKPASWSELAAVAAGMSWADVRACFAIPVACGVWRRRTAPNCGLGSRGKPGIISREKVAEALCSAWICDSRRAAAELGFRSRDSARRTASPKTLAWYKEAGWLKY